LVVDGEDVDGAVVGGDREGSSVFIEANRLNIGLSSTYFTQLRKKRGIGGREGVPRRNSLSFFPDSVSKMRNRVPLSEAVARNFPSRLRHI
jgi:hypothetical protein